MTYSVILRESEDNMYSGRVVSRCGLFLDSLALSAVLQDAVERHEATTSFTKMLATNSPIIMGKSTRESAITALQSAIAGHLTDRDYFDEAHAGNGPVVYGTSLLDHAVQRQTASLRERSSKQISEINGFVSRCEDLVFFVKTLKMCDTYDDFFVACVTYLKTFLSGSLLLTAKNVLCEHCNDFLSLLEIEQQDSSSTGTTFIAKFRSFVDTWRSEREGPAAEKFCNLISLLTIVNMVPLVVGDKGTGLNTQTGDFFVNGYRLFTTRVMDMQKDTVDVMQMVMETVLFYLERGFLAFTTSNPKALLFTDSQLCKMDEEFSVLCAAEDLLESGQLTRLRAPNVPTIIDEQDYCNRLEKLIDTVSQALNTEGLHPGSQANLRTKLARLMKLSASLINAQQTKALRIRPFAVEIYGPSSCAKTMVNKAVLKTICAANGFPADERNFAVINEAEKFDTDIKAGTVAVTVDDFANTRVEHTEGCPHKRIIDMVNNVCRNAVKADLAGKGTVPIQPKIFTITTNVLDLNAHAYSNEPVSVLRRFDYILDVKLRTSHKDDSGGFDSTKFEADRDAWSITVKRVRIGEKTNGKKITPYTYINDLEDASINEVCAFLKEKSQAHYERQHKYIESLEQDMNAEMCPHGNIAYFCNKCANATFDEQHSGMGPPRVRPHVPERIVLPSVDSGMFWSVVTRLYCLLLILKATFVWFPPRLPRATDIFKHNAYGQQLRAIASNECALRWAQLRAGTLDTVATLSESFKHIYANIKGSEILAVLTTIGASSFAMYKMYTHFAPKKECDVSEDDFQEQHDGIAKLPYDDQLDVWKKVVVEKRDMSSRSVGSTFQQVCDFMGRHLHLLHKVDPEGHNTSVNCFPLKGNYWLVPNHFLPEERTYEVILTKTPKHVLGKKVRTLLSPSLWTRLPGYDFMVVQIPDAGSVPDMTKFLPEEPYTGASQGVMVSRNFAYDVEIANVTQMRYLDECGTSTGKYAGYVFERERDCYPGLCMSVVLPTEKEPQILGFHLYGVRCLTEKKKGMAGFVPKSILLCAMESKDSIFDVMCSGVIPDSSLGIEYGMDYIVHPRHAVRFQRDCDGSFPSLEVHGAHTGIRVSNKSHVKQLPISSTVHKKLDLPNKHGPPKFKEVRKHWHTDLETMCHPSSCINAEILRAAYDDVIRKYDNVLVRAAASQLSPLSLAAVTSGLDGIRGIDRIDLSTSVGFPVNKKKRDFCKIIEGDERTAEIIEFDQKFLDMADSMEEKYLSGERAYPIFRACMKDEALPVEKDKIRVFSGCQLAFLLIVRKYFLPITRMEHVLWEKLETCVGINAHGPDWTILANRMQKFGSNQYIAGDYSKYDKRTNPAFTLAAMHVYIWVARASGNYSERDLAIMRGIATDVAYPLYEYDGVFIEMFSSWTSGVPITVDGNNIMNMLYLRYAYYGLAIEQGFDPYLIEDFDRGVNAMMYGDDNMMEVHEDFGWFNHTTVQEYLSTIGMKYTMADKSSDSIPFIPLEEVTFLKRSFRWCKDIGEYVAPLDEDSIAKSLHNYHDNKSSDATPEAISNDAIDNALTEYFRHGREVYNKRSSELQEVIDAHDFLPQRNVPTYDEMVKAYHEKYHDKPTVVTEDIDMVFDEPQSGCLNHEWGFEAETEGLDFPFVPHSGEAEPVTEDNFKTTTFETGAPGFEISDTGRDATREAVVNPQLTLEQFFDRSVEIGVFEWAAGFTHVEISPWSLFFQDRRVQNRLTNFRTVSCELEVRFEVTGNTFMSGAMLVSYYPFANPELPTSRPAIEQDAIQESQRMSFWLDPCNGTGGTFVLPFLFEFDKLDIIRADWSTLGFITMRPVAPLLISNGSAASATITIFATGKNVKFDVGTSFNSAGLQPQDGENDEYAKKDGPVSRPASAIASMAGMLKNMPVIGRYAKATEIGARGIAWAADKMGYCRPSNIRDEEKYSPRYFGAMAKGEGADTCEKLSLTVKQELTIDPTTMGSDPQDEMSFAAFNTTESYLTQFQWNEANLQGDRLFSIALSPTMYDVRDLGQDRFEYLMTPMCGAAQVAEYWRGTIKVRFKLVTNAYQAGKIRIAWEPGENSPLGPLDWNVVESQVIDIKACDDFTIEVGWGNPAGFLRVPGLSTIGAVPFGATIASPREFYNGNLNVYVMNPLTNPSAIIVPVRCLVIVSGGDDLQYASPTTDRINNLSIFFPQSGENEEYETMPQQECNNTSPREEARRRLALRQMRARQVRRGDLREHKCQHCNRCLCSIFEPQSGENAEYAAVKQNPMHTTPNPSGGTCVYKLGHFDDNPNTNLVYFGERLSLVMLLKRFVHLRSDLTRGSSAGGNRADYWAIERTIIGGFRGNDPNGEDSGYAYFSVPYFNYFVNFFGAWRTSMRYKVAMTGDLTAQGADMHGLIGIERVAAPLVVRSVRVQPSGQNVADAAFYGVQAYSRTGDGVELQPITTRGTAEAEVPYQRNTRFTRSRQADMSTATDMPGVRILTTGNANNSKERVLQIFMATGEDVLMAHKVGWPPMYQYIDPAP